MHEIVALGGFATTTVRSASHWRAPRARAGALCGRRRSSEGLGHAHDGARVLVDEVAVASRRRRHLRARRAQEVQEGQCRLECALWVRAS